MKRWVFKICSGFGTKSHFRSNIDQNVYRLILYMNYNIRDQQNLKVWCFTRLVYYNSKILWRRSGNPIEQEIEWKRTVYVYKKKPYKTTILISVILVLSVSVSYTGKDFYDDLEKENDLFRNTETSFFCQERRTIRSS